MYKLREVNKKMRFLLELRCDKSSEVDLYIDQVSETQIVFNSVVPNNFKELFGKLKIYFFIMGKWNKYTIDKIEIENCTKENAFNFTLNDQNRKKFCKDLIRVST